MEKFIAEEVYEEPEASFIIAYEIDEDSGEERYRVVDRNSPDEFVAGADEKIEWFRDQYEEREDAGQLEAYEQFAAQIFRSCHDELGILEELDVEEELEQEASPELVYEQMTE